MRCGSLLSDNPEGYIYVCYLSPLIRKKTAGKLGKLEGKWFVFPATPRLQISSGQQSPIWWIIDLCVSSFWGLLRNDADSNSSHAENISRDSYLTMGLLHLWDCWILAFLLRRNAAFSGTCALRRLTDREGSRWISKLHACHVPASYAYAITPDKPAASILRAEESQMMPSYKYSVED